MNEPAPAWDALTPEEIDAIIEQYYMWVVELAIWWYDRMAANNITIREMMTLFWHNHFAVEADKVFFPQAMYRQNSLFRGYSVGNIKELVKEIAIDPAMLIYFDGNWSTVGHINENFVPEVLELFTIGISNDY